ALDRDRARGLARLRGAGSRLDGNRSRAPAVDRLRHSPHGRFRDADAWSDGSLSLVHLLVSLPRGHRGRALETPRVREPAPAGFMTYATLVAVALVASLVIYALGGGADFGGGVWDLLAAGPRAGRQRETIAHAIGPIWEANHVWLILAIVLLFTCFPAAFAAIGTALHIPITVLLVGIVLRGSAFTFRSYGLEPGHVQDRWGRVFACASLVSAIMLGVTLGAIPSGTLGMDPASGQVRTDFISSWCASFPFAVGFLALALFAYLAAAYLTLETEDDDLRDDFRKRALIAWEI